MIQITRILVAVTALTPATFISDVDDIHFIRLLDPVWVNAARVCSNVVLVNEWFRLGYEKWMMLGWQKNGMSGSACS